MFIICMVVNEFVGIQQMATSLRQKPLELFYNEYLIITSYSNKTWLTNLIGFVGFDCNEMVSVVFPSHFSTLMSTFSLLLILDIVFRLPITLRLFSKYTNYNYFSIR